MASSKAEIGKKYGRLTVIEKDNSKDIKHQFYQ